MESIIIRDDHSSNRPAPFCKRTDPEISMVLSTDQMAPKIEQIGHGNENRGPENQLAKSKLRP
jgi:hypothetical protein